MGIINDEVDDDGVKIAKTTAMLYKLLNDNIYTIKNNHFTTFIILLDVLVTIYKTFTNPIFIVQLLAVRIISRTCYGHPTNTLIHQISLLMFYDLVDSSCK